MSKKMDPSILGHCSLTFDTINTATNMGEFHKFMETNNFKTW